MRNLQLAFLLPIMGGFFLCGGQGRSADDARSALPSLSSSTDVITGRPDPASYPKRLDSQYPLPPLEPAVSEARGIRVVDWGYRFTQPGNPDNSLLIQARVKNESGKARKVLAIAGLRHGVPWVLPGPAWYRVDMQEIELLSGEEERITFEFRRLQNIHIGIKAKFYQPCVIVKEPDDFDRTSGMVGGVRIIDWNYTIVARPRGPHPAKFVAVLRNFDRGAKRVVLRTELIPRPDADKYEGPPEGFTEDHTIEIPEGSNLFLAQMPMLSTSGISRHFAPTIFDAGVHIVSVD